MKLADGLVVGLAGAASIALTDAVVSRVDPVSQSRFWRGIGRIALGLGGAVALQKVNAPEPLIVGVIAGPTMVTVLEATIAMIPRKRLEPPAAQSVQALGQPWAPSVLV